MTWGDGFLEIAESVAVHGAVQVDAGDAHAVGRDDAVDRSGVADARGALVVDDEIVAFGIFGIFLGGQGRLHRGVGRVHLRDLDVEPFFEAVFEDVLLGRVVMATTAGDQEDFG